jgi:LDH2 family malate/lactate/ureidoglycolate dehydrogenase
MIELLAAGLVCDDLSYEAIEADNRDGGPAIGGQFVLAMSPDVLAGPGWADHSEALLSELSAMEGVRLPGARRFANRHDTGPREINAELVEPLRSQR